MLQDCNKVLFIFGFMRLKCDVGRGTAMATDPFLLNGGGTDFRRSDSDFDMHKIRLTATFRF